YGQFRAGIQGTVTDTNGAVVPGARVSLKSNETGRTLQTVTTDAGFYSFTMLSPGTYTITVTAGDSFKKAVVEKIQVRAETTEGVNITLEPGGI
ncbi:carboxypeptidase-like regulatory domain-containing protein, partial [Escherichia coli]|nr:carboxypeptidase-like regulatory domain-containing protein [Escherichia coli]